MTTNATLTTADKAKLRKQTRRYKEISAYVGDWGIEVDKAKLVRDIHKNLMGVNKLGKLRPYEDLAFFLMIAQQYQLNPLKKEIYATYQREQKGKEWVEKITPIVSIHGLRKSARRAKNPTYAYTGKAELGFKENGDLDSSTVPVFGRFENDNTIVKVGEYTAYYDEFVKTKTDKDTGEAYATGKWKNAPRMMLTKCAEANAIRMSFDISGLYIEEEIVGDQDQILKLTDGSNDIEEE